MPTRPGEHATAAWISSSSRAHPRGSSLRFRAPFRPLTKTHPIIQQSREGDSSAALFFPSTLSISISPTEKTVLVFPREQKRDPGYLPGSLSFSANCVSELVQVIEQIVALIGARHHIQQG